MSSIEDKRSFKTYVSTKDIAKLVREQLKKDLPLWKFSVTMHNFSGGSSITLRLVSGPEEVLVSSDYAQLNQYDFLRDRSGMFGYSSPLTLKGWDVMKQATKILSAYHWDESNAQIDYFCCNFYMHVEIGKWDKPYEVKK